MIAKFHYEDDIRIVTNDNKNFRILAKYFKFKKVEWLVVKYKTYYLIPRFKEDSKYYLRCKFMEI